MKTGTRAYEAGKHLWHIGMAPETLLVRGHRIPHPAHRSAIFVVHGMGQPGWATTAAVLRSGFEDALEAIEAWQRRHGAGRIGQEISIGDLPSPYILDGYWGDYPSIEQTFPVQWKHFDEKERGFFAKLWGLRTLSVLRTYGWFFRQQVRLLAQNVGPFVWVLYFLLQFLSTVSFLVILVRYPRVFTKYLTDVRLYLDPRGTVERAIVQNIDYRVGAAFLRLIGLDWEFRPLAPGVELEIAGKVAQFRRVVWVAHSLGTVISYNVLSDLFHRAQELEIQGDPVQREGVKRFRRALRRFVTLGSPLDKVAALFQETAIRPWPKSAPVMSTRGGPGWWVNFHHVLDPVSGALSHPLLCREMKPRNLHSGLFKIPLWAHVGYWCDLTTMRYILGRTYGKWYLRDRDFQAPPPILVGALAVLSYGIWGILSAIVLMAVFVWGWAVIGPILGNLGEPLRELLSKLNP